MRKTCTRCKEEKHLDSFHKRSLSKDGRRTVCKSCRAIEASETWKREKNNGLAERNADYTLRYKYNITLQDYNKMLEDQGSVCAICKKEETNGKRFAVDHCHLTNVVRGLLCSNCNRGIGHLQDDVQILSSAIEYLNKNSSHHKDHS